MPRTKWPGSDDAILCWISKTKRAVKNAADVITG
jgi:hypothetical protein